MSKIYKSPAKYKKDSQEKERCVILGEYIIETNGTKASGDRPRPVREGEKGADSQQGGTPPARRSGYKAKILCHEKGFQLKVKKDSVHILVRCLFFCFIPLQD